MNRWWPWILVLSIALVVRLGGAMAWQARLTADRPFLFADSESYWLLGQTIARGEPYQFGGPTAKVFRTPGYPVVLAGVIRLFGAGPAGVLAARLVGVALGMSCVGLTIWWARHLFGSSAAWWAGLFVACYPGAVMLSVVVLSEAAFCPALLVHLGCWTRGATHATPAGSCVWSAAAGAAAACATLCRPSWLLFMPFAGLVSLIGGSRRRRIRELAVGMVAFACVMAPWWWRNYHVVGRFVPTTLQVGASLYDGLNAQATGASQMDFVPRFERQLAGEWAMRHDPRDESFEYELDRRMRDASLDWAGRNPSRVVELAWIKFQRMWNVWPNDEQFRSFGMRAIVALTYVPLVLGAACGVLAARRRGWPVTLCYLPAVYFTLLHVIFVGSLRYREPAMFGFTVLAAACVAASERRGTRP